MSNKLTINPKAWESIGFVMEAELVDPSSRCLFDWRDNPPQVPNRHHVTPDYDYNAQANDYRHAIFTDSILQRLIASKTFIAMVETYPSIEKVPITFEYMPEKFLASYSKEKDRAQFSYSYRRNHGDNMTAYTSFAAHEFRHAWHKRIGIFDNTDRMTVTDLILLNRAYEADSAAFHITVARDLDLMDDESHLEFLRTHRPYIACTNALETAYKKVHDGLDDWDWSEAYEAGNPADENGLPQQAAFDAFFKTRLLKLAYDHHAIGTFKRHNRNRKYKIDKTESKTLLVDKLKSLSTMPYINFHGEIVERENYSPEAVLLSPVAKKYDGVFEASTLIQIRHASKRQQPIMPRPPHI